MGTINEIEEPFLEIPAVIQQVAITALSPSGRAWRDAAVENCTDGSNVASGSFDVIQPGSLGEGSCPNVPVSSDWGMTEEGWQWLETGVSVDESLHNK